jgi:hypothetical protein
MNFLKRSHERLDTKTRCENVYFIAKVTNSELKLTRPEQAELSRANAVTNRTGFAVWGCLSHRHIQCR